MEIANTKGKAFRLPEGGDYEKVNRRGKLMEDKGSSSEVCLRSFEVVPSPGMACC